MSDEKDYTVFADKPATPLQEDFAEWIPEVTGYDPAAAKSKQAAFDAGVRLAVSLRIPYQASDHNKTRTAEMRAANAKERAERAAKVKAKAKAAEAEVADAEETEEAAAPPKKTVAKRTAAKKAAGVKTAPF